MRCVFRCCLVLLTFVVSACADPPLKEMNQAQGAIDAARAAGAEQFAPQEFRSSVDALQKSEQAVTQKDYRLALSLAIDSRERAQQAAKVAVDARANARGDAERVVVEASMRLSQARERLKDPAAARVPRRALDQSAQALDAAEKIMQEARAALSQNDFGEARRLARDASARIQEALSAFDKTGPASPNRKRSDARSPKIAISAIC
jgi:hypothetical protein